MRGAPLGVNGDDGYEGIIPADAGSTGTPVDNSNQTEDHPRGCGEHCCITFSMVCFCGSSPRMRGAQSKKGYYFTCEGIIPADAGSTPRLALCIADSRDHPRGCGEHSPGTGLSRLLAGSSPRMRGALSTIQSRRSPRRIIPADAGSTYR